RVQMKAMLAANPSGQLGHSRMNDARRLEEAGLLGAHREGIELGFFEGRPLIYDGTEPVAIDAQAGKGKLARFLGANLVSPRTRHLTKIVTDPKDAELAWVSWKTLERQGYRVRFINPGKLYGYE